MRLRVLSLNEVIRRAVCHVLTVDANTLERWYQKG